MWGGLQNGWRGTGKSLGSVWDLKHVTRKRDSRDLSSANIQVRGPEKKAQRLVKPVQASSRHGKE